MRPLRVRSFRCTLCSDVSSSVANLMQHYENVHPLSSFKCTVCGESVPSFAEIRDHFRRLHKGMTICCCRICGDVFSDKNLLKQHRAVHGLKRDCSKKDDKLGPSKWCPICNNFFTTNRDFREHISLNKNCEQQLNEKLNAVSNVECEQCRKMFPSLQIFDLHVTVHNGDPPYCCTVCNDVFENSTLFDDHIATHYSVFLENDEASLQTSSAAKQKRSQYVCKVCSRGFPTLSSLTVHSYLHGGEKPFKCTECGLGFSHYSKLSNHQLVHQGEKLYRCSVCWKAFWAKNALLMHLKNHSIQSSDATQGSEAKQHQCTLCVRSFSKQSHLTNHMRWHDGEKGVLKKKFPCSECKRTFTTKAHLIIHEQMHKGVGLVCPECGKKFTTLAWLQYHMRIHTGESPTCPVCGRGFTTRRAMEAHLSSHEQGAFACETCGANFGSSRYLQAHIKLIHTGVVPVVCRKCGIGFTLPDELAQHESMCTNEMGKHVQTDFNQYVMPEQEVVVTTTSGMSENVIVVSQSSNNYISDNELVAATSTLQASLQPSLEIQDNIQSSFSNDFDHALLQSEEHDNTMIQEVYYNNPDNLNLASISEMQQTLPLNTVVIDNNNIQLPPGLVLDGSQDVVVQIVSTKQLEELLSFNSV